MANIPFFGNQVKFFTQITTASYVELTPYIESIELGKAKRDRIDNTGISDTAKVTVPGPVDYNEMKIQFKAMDMADANLISLFDLIDTNFTGSEKYCHIQMGTKTFSFTGSYYEYDLGQAEFGKPVKGNITFKPNSKRVS